MAINLLSAAECKNATSNGAGIRKLHDGDGLYLWVYQDGRKYWRCATGRQVRRNPSRWVSIRDDCARVDLTYADTGEQVKLSPKLLKLHEGEQPQRCRRERKERGDVSIGPKRVSRRLDDAPIPELDIVEQLLLMDGCMKVQIQRQAASWRASQQQEKKFALRYGMNGKCITFFGRSMRRGRRARIVLRRATLKVANAFAEDLRLTL